MVAKEHKTKFAVIGCGHIGKRHAEMILRNGESELVGFVDVKDKSASIISLTNERKSYFGSHPSLVLDLVGSPINNSTSVGRKYIGSTATTSFPGSIR